MKMYNGFYANANINIYLMNTDQVLMSCHLTLSEHEKTNFPMPSNMTAYLINLHYYFKIFTLNTFFPIMLYPDIIWSWYLHSLAL